MAEPEPNWTYSGQSVHSNTTVVSIAPEEYERLLNELLVRRAFNGDEKAKAALRRAREQVARGEGRWLPDDEA